MDNWLLKSNILEQIQTDGILYGKVANALDKSPATLPALLRNNDARLTQKRILVIISEHLNIPEEDLTETEPVTN